MSLNWDATKVRDFDSLTTDEKTSLQSLIFATMSVGFNTITVENARQFFARLSFVEKILGASRDAVDDDGTVRPLYFTSDEVLRFIGLRTNASNLTDAAFRKQVWEGHTRWNVPRGI